MISIDIMAYYSLYSIFREVHMESWSDKAGDGNPVYSSVLKYMGKVNKS
jgi:hypothetical protein